MIDIHPLSGYTPHCKGKIALPLTIEQKLLCALRGYTDGPWGDLATTSAQQSQVTRWRTATAQSPPVMTTRLPVLRNHRRRLDQDLATRSRPMTRGTV